MKSFTHFLSALVALVVLSTVIFILARPRHKIEAAKAAQVFFGVLAEDRLYDAYRSTASALREQPFEEFETAVLQHQVERMLGVEMTPIGDSMSEVRFRVTPPPAEGKEPVRYMVSLVRELGAWRVYSISAEDAGSIFRPLAEDERTLSAEVMTSSPSLPSDHEMKQLARNTLIKFNEALQLRYFGPFYQFISTTWQQQTSAANLEAAFKGFIERGITFPDIRAEDVDFRPAPEIDRNNLLRMRGFVPSANFVVGFDLTYAHEGDRWKLFGINLNLQPRQKEPALEAPSPGPGRR